jgi:hypothetical protein
MIMQSFVEYGSAGYSHEANEARAFLFLILTDDPVLMMSA